LVAVLLAIVYARIDYLHSGAIDAIEVAMGLVIPVFSVWYPDLMSGAVASIRLTIFRTELVDESVVLFIGWAALILPGAILVGAWVAQLLGWV